MLRFGVLLAVLLTNCSSFFFDIHKPHLLTQKTDADCAYCYPGTPCWPSISTIKSFGNTLRGKILFPGTLKYRQLAPMRSLQWTKYPGLIILASSTTDVQKAVRFATKHNLKISVQSSGHDYNGRSTNNGGVQINLSTMKEIQINLTSTRNPAGEITVQSGNNWGRVYEMVDKYDRIVVGGIEKTVAMGGYTLGGGHSPFCRSLGLAVDNLLEVELVTGTGTLVVANANGTRVISVDGHDTTSPDTNLFWALRGGGGGTFGIVTSFTFKLHHAPRSLVSAVCTFPFYNSTRNIGNQAIRAIDSYITSSLAPEWGGFVFTSGYDPPNTTFHGSVTLALIHFGEWGTPSFRSFQPLVNTIEPHGHCQFSNVSSFWNFQKNLTTTGYARQYFMNILLQNDSFVDSFYNLTEEYILRVHVNVSKFGCTRTLIGGKVSTADPNSTAINPAFRTGVIALSCYLFWSGDGSTDDVYIRAADEFAAKLLHHGKGVYLNEASPYLPNWKTAFWGNRYDKLLQIKRVWDSKNVFTCNHCVGSDEKIKAP